MRIKNNITRFIKQLCGTNQLYEQQQCLIKKLDNLTRVQSELYYATKFHDSIVDSPWLKYKSFSLGEWAADYRLMYTIFRTLNAEKPKNIIEFGLGQTSKMIHQYAQYYHACAITYEHDENWIQFFNESKEGDYPINIKLTELDHVLYKEYETLTYKDCLQSFADQKFDFIIVDGPFGSEHFSRSQLIELVENNLSHRFCIIMDDYERLGEKETISEVERILQSKTLDYRKIVYTAEKTHILICSSDLEFLTTI